MIQGCPVEVLDKILEYTPYSDPENAQATLCSLMLTCSHFRTIAKRHFIRIVCLSNADKVIAFVEYLMQVVESGDYGNDVLPIQHLAVVIKRRYSDRNFPRRPSGAEIEAERIVPFVITTAAPSLLTMAIFGVDAFNGIVVEGAGYHTQQPCVPVETIFPKLRDLIALKQSTMPIVPLVHNVCPDERACRLKYPSLRRLYIPGYGGGRLPSALPYLHDLRLEILNASCISPPSKEQVEHVHSLIIDALKYLPFISSNCFRYSQSRDEYDDKFSKYQILVDKVGNSECNGVVVPVDGFTLETNHARIVSAWADAVVGGEGCWTTTWIPTVPGTSGYDW